MQYTHSFMAGHCWHEDVASNHIAWACRRSTTRNTQQERALGERHRLLRTVLVAVRLAESLVELGSLLIAVAESVSDQKDEYSVQVQTVQWRVCRREKQHSPKSVGAHRGL